MKRVLIIEGARLIGSHLADELRDRELPP